LGDWHLIVPQLQSWLNDWAALSSGVPEEVALVAVLLPIALAILSRRVIIVLASVLLAVMAFCVFISPSNSALFLAAGIYLGSLITAFSGVMARRKAGAFQIEFASLRQDVSHLLQAEERRYLGEMRSSTKEPER
jgi:hypothetical protein